MREDLIRKISLVLLLFGFLLLFLAVFWYPVYYPASAVSIIVGFVLLLYPQFKDFKAEKPKVKFSGQTVAAIALVIIIMGVIINAIDALFLPDSEGLGNGLVFWGFVLVVVAIGIKVIQEHWG
jgi:hypothetical protein